MVDRTSYRNEARVVELRKLLSNLGDTIGDELVRVPQYRFAYLSLISMMKKWKLYKEDYHQLMAAIPNFDLQTGYSCAIASMFQLSKKAEEFQPGLFSQILPTLRSKENLVITVYFRSNFADGHASAEKAGEDFVDDAEKHKKAAKKVIQCVLAREIEFLSKRGESTVREVSYPRERISDFSRIVWLVVSDSVGLKEMMYSEFNGINVNAGIPSTQQRYKGRVIERSVLTTKARGIHTRAKRKTVTADWAEAMIDWFLIGESDLVVSSGSMSFGETAALRTQRPLFLFAEHKCSRYDLIYSRGNSTLPEEETNAANRRGIWIPQ